MRPELAGIGAVPHSGAKEAEECSRSGLSSAVINSWAPTNDKSQFLDQHVRPVHLAGGFEGATAAFVIHPHGRQANDSASLRPLSPCRIPRSPAAQVVSPTVQRG